MSSSSFWISPLIEHCLSIYVTGQDPGSDWEDDGSNLRFSSRTQRFARINDLRKVNNSVQARLTDLDTQIDAILSKESLQEYNKEFPNKPLNKASILNYTIQLDSFELVYECFASPPGVILYVKRFSIAWARGKAQEPPRGRIVTKKPALVKLLKRVKTFRDTHQTSQETVNTVDSIGQSNEHGDIPSQAVNGHTHHAQRQLMSQLPPPDPPRSPEKSSVHNAAPSGKLLGLLVPTRGPETRQPSREMSMDVQPPQAVRPRRTSHISTSNEHRGLREKQSATAVGDRGVLVNVSSEPPASQSINRQSHNRSTKRTTPAPIAARQSPKKAPERSKSPDSPERQLLLEASQYANPWEGMDGISSVDVTVPADQKELLESDPKPWYPPPAGCNIVSGNVPPALLAKWNDLAFRRTQAEAERPESVNDDRPTTPSKPTDGASTGSVTDWSSSPERTPSRGVLPTDSSPVRDEDVRIRKSRDPREQRNLVKRIDLELQTIEENPVPQLDKNADPTQATADAESEPHPEANTSDMAGNGGHIPEGCSSDAGMASDGGSSDSEMDDAPDTEAIAQDIGRDGDGHDPGRSSDAENNDAPNPEVIAPGPGLPLEDTREPDGSSSSDDSECSSDAESNDAPSPEVVAPSSGLPLEDTHEPNGSSSSDDSDMNSASDAEAIAPGMTHDEEHESDASSDSEMSVAYPQPLSGSTQQGTSTQERVSSSGPTLPESASQKIQVAETPVVRSKSHPAMSNSEASRTGLGNAGFQSQADKSSSQSRILNTYASHEGDSKEQTSQESSRSVPATAPNPPNHVHVMGTPLSSQGPATQPTPWSAYTSSGQQIVDVGMPAALTYHSQSSKAFSSYRDMPSSSMLSIDDPVSPSIRGSARGTPLRHDRASPLKRFASDVDSDHGSPSKRAKVDHEPTAFKVEGGLDEHIITRHQSYIINSAQSMEAVGIYQTFRSNYPSYNGDYEHFTKMCSRLQSFRERGSLQRSFLWDDFIIKNLETYPSYLADCYSNNIKPSEYEEYFADTFSKPTYKKRRLGISDITACAAQVVTIDEPMDMSRELNDTKVSFTGSLRDQLSNLHTHSFTAQELAAQDRQFGNGQSEADQGEGDAESASQYSIPDSEPARAAARGDAGHHAQKAPKFSPVLEDSDEDMEDADTDIDLDDAAHETASVELGEDEISPESPQVESKLPAKPLPESPVPNTEFNKANEPAPAPAPIHSTLPAEALPEKPAADIALTTASDAVMDSGVRETSNKDNVSVPAPTPVQTKEPPPGPTPEKLAPRAVLASTPNKRVEVVFRTPSSATINTTGRQIKPASTPTPSRNKLPAHSTPQRPVSASRAAPIPVPVPVPVPNNVKDATDVSEEEEDAAKDAVSDEENEEDYIAGDTTETDEEMVDDADAEVAAAEAASEEEEEEPEAASEKEEEPEAADEDEDVAENATDEDEDEEDEDEPLNENWFTSLRHIFPAKPVWSDDPHTPFKKWARADQNVLSVRNRRGGLNIPVDEKGVIQRIPRA
ncbi:uncharacterized protein DSM5745_08801 [Aspergillus mulundensis]|uniref:Telomere replication protein EST3 n=1 Tax=Aspergillus mulundensis TaxID=1810919 RepID=A0A3D8R536_9EURO|nr:hypothetical protein DSM5745_08801 [Aspergillus mulundensis]RDW69041.1 hypothetical protein DSM5745_08801 [Aspergillus mulundensis]